MARKPATQPRFLYWPSWSRNGNPHAPGSEFLALHLRLGGSGQLAWLDGGGAGAYTAPIMFLLTPPMGLLIFTVKSSVMDPDVSLGDILIGSVPFWILMLGVAVLILLSPELATWLPGLMF